MPSHFSRVRLCVTLWTVAHQAPSSMGSSRKKTEWLPHSPPGDLPDPGIEPASLMSPVLATYLLFSTSATWGAPGAGQSQELRFCSQNLLQLQQSRGL